MMVRKDFIYLVLIFLIWRTGLFLLSLVSVNIPLANSDKFLGGGFVNYNILPYFFGLANFDGEHYLSISIIGYRGLEQAFFPVYPTLMGFVAKIFSYDFNLMQVMSIFAGLFISNLSFLCSLILLFDLITKDYSKKIAYLTIFSLVLFPTSFYLGALYSESLFLLLILLAFYFARNGRWMEASITGVISSATRIFGVVLLPSFIIEAYLQNATKKTFFYILLVPLGLLSYMFYQWVTVDDPIAFYRLQKIVGEQHQSGITLLPQVFYRYIKILLTVDPRNPIYTTMLLEFITGIAFFLLPIYGYFKNVRFSYLTFSMLSFLLPSIQGSLSSVPRYMLVFFPTFLIIGLILDKAPKWVKMSYFIFSGVWLCFEAVMFIRGYWVA